MRKFSLSLLVALCMVMAISAVAFAAHNDKTEVGAAFTLGHTDKSATGGSAFDCAYCHENQTKHTSGPHGGYTTTTNRCTTCHGLHANPDEANKAWNEYLLPGATTVEVCNYCHDLTQTDLAPYYTSYMSDGQLKSAHKVKGLSVTTGAKVYNFDTDYELSGAPTVPGGDYTDGGDAGLVTAGQGELSEDFFTCDSCHTPHAIKGATVAPYLGESHIKVSGATSDQKVWTSSSASVMAASSDVTRLYVTDRLLKASLQDPNKTRSTDDMVYTKYNSNWCAGCHMGRYASDATRGIDYMHNHPVAMGDANADADGYQFLNIAQADGLFVNSWTPASVITDVVTKKNANGIYPNYYVVKNVVGALKVGSAYATAADVILTKDPRSNKQYTMTGTDPITGNTRADGYLNIADYTDGPSCQQCHGSARNVEEAFSAQEIQTTTFPHASTNAALLVENNDDFCTNCHGLDNLP